LSQQLDDRRFGHDAAENTQGTVWRSIRDPLAGLTVKFVAFDTHIIDVYDVYGPVGYESALTAVEV
jgi:hypothetical protein